MPQSIWPLPCWPNMDNCGEVVVMSLSLVRVIFMIAAEGLWYELTGLIMIGFVALVVELIASTHGLQHFNPRHETSPGIYMAALLVPLVLVARLLQHVTSLEDFEVLRFEFWSSVASSIGLLVYIWWTLNYRKNLSRIMTSDGDLKVFFTSMVSWATLALIPPSLAFLFPIKFTNVLFHIIGTMVLFHHGYHTFPGCASVGEAMLVANGLTTYVGNAAIYTFSKVGFETSTKFNSMSSRGKDTIAAILQALLIGLACVPYVFKLLATICPRLLALIYVDPAKAKATTGKMCDAVAFYLALIMALVIATGWLFFVHGLRDDPVTWVFNFVWQDTVKLSLCGYWLVILCTLVLPSYMIKSTKFEQIMVRKVFHLVVVIMFIPALLIQPSFLKLALAVALAGFLVAEMIRVYRIPPFGDTIHTFMAAFTDSRDSDVLIISHFSLLLGCALPLWLTSSKNDRPLASYAGVLSLGIGDTMASVIGYNYGLHRISRTNKKTLEGTIAGILSMFLACLAVQLLFLKPSLNTEEFVSLAVAVLCTGLMEAYTTQLDNAFIPLLFYALLSL